MTATIASSSRCEPPVEPTFAEQYTPLQIASECNEVSLTETVAELRGAGRGVVRFAELARAQMSLADWQQQVALLDAVPPLLLDQTLRPTQPSARPPGFSERKQAKPQPERGPCRGQALARFETCVIQALLRRQHLLVPRGQPRRPGQTVQILRAERRRLIRSRERLEGIVPFVPLETGTPSLERSRNVGPAALGIAIIGLARWHRSGKAKKVGDKIEDAGDKVKDAAKNAKK